MRRMDQERPTTPHRGFEARSFSRRLLVAGIVLALVTNDALASDPRSFETQHGVLWEPFQEWSLTMAEEVAQPFDVEGIVVFDHVASDARHTTRLFYDGGNVWSFRFTGTRSGTWRFATASPHDDLDGWTGVVEVEPSPDAQATGFLTTAGSRMAVPIDEDGTLAARTYHVYQNTPFKNSLHDYSTDPVALETEIAQILGETEAHGMDAVFVAMNNNWFAFGASAWHDHDSQVPSLESFAVLETLILRAHERGLSVHIWAWGDEERGWTPIGVGGINGEADRRLQRYIAARLGPLPGWTISYGFDLNEWVTPAQVRSWWSYMHAHLGWPRLLMARESQADVGDPFLEFDLGAHPLDMVSSDERPEDDFFASARALLARDAGPVLYERRFLHTRDGVWDQTTTRRAMWQFTLAGAAGGVWGVLWNDGEPYPETDTLHTHGRFWRHRLALDLDRASELGSDGTVIALADAAATRLVVYAEATSRVPLDVSAMRGSRRAVAIDTARPYAELDLGDLAAEDGTWEAPYASDWVVAVGDF